MGGEGWLNPPVYPSRESMTDFLWSRPRRTEQTASAMAAEKAERLGVRSRADRRDRYSDRRTFSIFLPLASSSTSLSRYRTFCVRGFSISSTR